MFKKIIKLPILTTAFFIALMFVIDALNIVRSYSFQSGLVISIAISCFGLLIIIVGAHAFKKAQTTVNPINPEKTTKLVITGVYNYSRNPMYVGFFAWLISAVIFIGNPVNLLLLPLYVFLVNKLYIDPEEKALDKLFGHEYAEYKNKVRRWV